MAEFFNWKNILTDGPLSNDGKASIGIFSEWKGPSVVIRVSDETSIFHAECPGLQKSGGYCAGSRIRCFCYPSLFRNVFFLI